MTYFVSSSLYMFICSFVQLLIFSSIHLFTSTLKTEKASHFWTPITMFSVKETEAELHTMCSSKNFIEIVKDLTTKQRECIEDMGFGVLLNINCLVFHLPLCEMLLKSIAPKTKDIVLHGKSIQWGSPTLKSDGVA